MVLFCLEAMNMHTFRLGVKEVSIVLTADKPEILTEIDENNRLAARAAEGDREALRESVETDPAMSGLDRLYCLEVVQALIRMHEDMLPLWAEQETAGLSDRI